MYISPNGYLGGAERFILTAVKAHAAGSKISASILFFSNGEACDEARQAGLNFYILKQSFRFRYPWKLFSALMEIRAFIKHLKPEVLHLTMPYAHISISLATLGLNLKKVWFQHGPVGGHLDQLANLFPVDAILYNSLDLQTRHRQTWPKARIKKQELIINLGVSSSNGFHPLFLNSPLILGAAGRICSGKGYHNLLIALGELKREETLKPFKLQIAGAAKMSIDKKYRDQLKKLTHTYNLFNEVEFLEHQTNMEAFYQELDIFIHSAVLEEGFGLVIAEAMLNGCLVIASNSGGVKDLVHNNINGLNFSSTSSNAISELKKILNIFLNTKENFSREKYQAIAINGKEFIQKNYSIDKMRDQLENLYLKL